MRWADRCNKREKKTKGIEFRSRITKIDAKSDSVMAYRYVATDSITWMLEHKKRFDIALDSSIQYYKDNYTKDEERHKIYLKILYQYKKLSYLYADWIKTSRINENPAKKEKDYKLLTPVELRRKHDEIIFDMGKHNVDLIMLD